MFAVQYALWMVASYARTFDACNCVYRRYLTNTHTRARKINWIHAVREWKVILCTQHNRPSIVCSLYTVYSYADRRQHSSRPFPDHLRFHRIEQQKKKKNKQVFECRAIELRPLLLYAFVVSFSLHTNYDTAGTGIQNYCILQRLCASVLYMCVLFFIYFINENITDKKNKKKNVKWNKNATVHLFNVFFVQLLLLLLLLLLSL